MHSPIAAFAWELWRKNHRRLVLIFGVLIGFIIVYPSLCSLMAGINPANSFSIDEFARNFRPMSHDEPLVLKIGRVLLFLFLLAGPITTMFLSLLCVVWMFTVLEFDPTSKNSPSIPGRLFNLPISTSFLFAWLLLSGMAMIFVVYEGWTRFVRMPYIDVFGEFQKCIGWMTFLAMGQAVVWGLAGWPVTRFVASFALVFCFMAYPTWQNQNPLFTDILLPFLFLVGVSLAAVGLRKMRHGQWQGWTWKRSLATASTHRPLRRPGRFASPSQAQLWFEWRRFARNLCFFIAGFSLVPELVHLLVRLVVGRPLQDETLFGFTIILFTMPLILHGLGAMSPARANHSFLMNRPLTGGEMMMAVLKAAAVSTVLSWVIVFVALVGMPLLGDFEWVKRRFLPPAEYQAPFVIGLIYLTWRFYVTNLCFARSGSKWLTDLPILMFLTPVAGAPSCSPI